MTEASLLDMVRRLLALGQSPNEHEARAAIAKAEALMRKYNLFRAECEAAYPDTAGWTEASAWEGTTRLPAWVDAAARIVNSYFFVRVIVATRPQNGRPAAKVLSVFGRPENVAVGQHTLMFLVDAYRSLWDAYRQKRCGTAPGLCRAFCDGLASGTAQQIEADRHACATTGTGRALMVLAREIDAALDERYQDLQGPHRAPRPPAPTFTNAAAFLAGQAHGRKIRIRPGLDDGTRPLLSQQEAPC